MATDSIDRQSATPYYQQLFAVLQRRLNAGDIARDERLPSENELCTEFGLSRATVRQALQLLETRGLVTRVPGRGVFASQPSSPPGWVIQGPEGFLENAIGHQNRAVTTEALRHGPTLLPRYACRALEVPENTAGFQLVRLRSLDGTPALYSINYSPPALVPVVAAAQEVLAGRASLTELLADAGYTLGGAHREIRAVGPTPEIAAALEITPDTPILHIRSTSWTPRGERYDVYDTWVRSEVVPLEVNVDTGEK
ncbi:GntR family transcriptional regulator [Nocardia sp. NPDC019395]|uniref:GntR family transcriptional regulator n=1 Tax=Nocardia sp. NPDC019395 TaxID=3154686 RepID=UPI0033CC779B